MTTTGSHARTLPVTDLSLVVLVGASGSGKSTFARRHFKPTEVISSRLLPRAGRRRRERPERQPRRLRRAALHRGQAARGRAAAPSSTRPTSSRRAASSWSTWPGSTTCCPSPSSSTSPRRSAPHATRRAPTAPAWPATSSRATSANCAARCAAWSARASARCTSCAASRRSTAPRSYASSATTTCTHLTGPFDIIGDIHGCSSELETLLSRARLRRTARTPRAVRRSSSATSSTAGPTSPACCAASWRMVDVGPRAVRARQPREQARPLPQGQQGPAHPRPRRDRRAARGRGREDPVPRARSPSSSTAWSATTCWTAASSSCATPGLPEKYHGRTSGRVRSHALYGDTTGETDEFGLPVRYPWAEDYRGSAAVVYGHTPVPAGRLAQQHHLPRHRRRVRRQADRAALAGARAGRRTRRAGLVRAGRSRCAPRRPAASDGRPLDLADVHGPAVRRDAARWAASRCARRTRRRRSRS